MNVSQSVKMSFAKSIDFIKTRKEVLYMIVFALALIAFEAFNYSTTDYALSDLLGGLQFAGIRWATLLSIAFCGIDFAGIALLMSPQNEQNESRSEWFMFGAWILAATMNALLTWWGVVLAIQSHPVVSAGVVDEGFVASTVPVFIALMVWIIRILVVGSFSKNGNRLVRDGKKSNMPGGSRRELRQAQSRAAHPSSLPVGFNSTGSDLQRNAKRVYRPEPTYIPMQEEPAFHSLKATEHVRR